MAFLRTLRKLVLGETWVVPIGVAITIGVAGLLDAIAGGHELWRRGGGFVVLAGVVATLVVTTARPKR